MRPMGTVGIMTSLQVAGSTPPRFIRRPCGSYSLGVAHKSESVDGLRRDGLRTEREALGAVAETINDSGGDFRRSSRA
jgi:hypothetical protein